MLSSSTDVHPRPPNPPLRDVLIVESQLSARKALERLLEGLNLGVRYRSASCAAQAQQEIRVARPDLVLSNLNLSDLSGLELCRSLQADRSQANQPQPDQPQLDQPPADQLTVVLLGDVAQAEAQAAGAAGVLGLPLEQFELARLLAELFAAPSSVQSDRPSAATLAQVLIRKLLERPGVIAISAYNQGGELVEEAGQPLPPELGRRARTYLSAARWLNKSEATLAPVPSPAALCTIQVEYGARTLLLFEQPSGVIACLLRDSASASLMKYWLRSAR
ncbi:response regulator [Deinococcus sp.]|uniref:response regulator n=1 Tax=Deinococcus sp. TaxID=47478 RepID=UPI0025E7B155|nr:response regulator [Deinococcus sp.]